MICDVKGSSPYCCLNTGNKYLHEIKSHRFEQTSHNVPVPPFSLDLNVMNAG